MANRNLTAAALGRLEARLTERDYRVLKRVSDLHFVSGSQLTRLCFADGDNLTADARTARRVLLHLTRLDMLRRLPRPVGGVRAGSAGFVYCLGPAGQALGMKRGWQPERRRRRSEVPGTLFLAHTLRVAELHTLLTGADRSRRLELLELSAEPTCHRSYGGIGTQRATLKPDSYVRLGAGQYEDSYFIEVDMGTEGSRALIAKLKDYVNYQASGVEQAERGVFPRTLWLAPDAERVSVIEDCIGRLPPAERGLFAVERFADALRVVTDTSDQHIPNVGSDGRE